MAYEAQLGDLKNQLQTSKNILIALPSTITLDKLASGLALFLSLKQLQKEVFIVTSDTIKVEHSKLFGVGQVMNSVPNVVGGNLTISLEGVVASDGTVPALDKLDWFPEGQNLNLVFHVLPGQQFQPSQITPKYQGGAFSTIFVIGANTLTDLGPIYSQNTQVFSNVSIINIDNSANNSQFGQVNLIDPNASSISEIVYQILPQLGAPIDQDISTNVLTGIYDVTSNLTVNVKPGAFIVVGQAMQNGGKLAQTPGQAPIPQTQPQPQMSQPIAPQAAPVPSAPQTMSGNAPLIDSNNLPQWLNFPTTTQPIQQSPSSVIQSPMDQFSSPAMVATPQPVQSAEERPQGEQAYSGNPEMDNPAPDWLTPKIFKGGNLE